MPIAQVPTLKDVAHKAGVSPMTASRALAGNVRVRPDALQRVLSAAAETGYRRNENARSLRPGQRTGLIGVVVTNLSNPYYAEMLRGVGEVTSALGMRTLVGESGEEPARQAELTSDFVGRRADGLVIVPAAGDSGQLAGLALSNTPVVLASRQVEELPFDTVMVDDVVGACEGTAMLLAEGHRRIAFIGQADTVFTSRRRLEGFALAHERAGVSMATDLIYQGHPDPAASQLAMRNALAQANPATAVFCVNNRNTLGAVRAVRDAGLPRSGPHGTRIVGFDNFDTVDLLPVHVSIIDHDAAELGRRAMHLLQERITGGARGAPRTVLLPTRLLP